MNNQSSRANAGNPKDGALRAALTRNASDVTVELIRDAILDGRFSPGERLKEEQLANDLNISRTPVREALLLLQAEGLIESVPNRGAVVRTFSAEELVDLYDLRALLEGYAARRAATRVTEQQLTDLEDSCARFRERRLVHDVKALVEENLFFHFTIVNAAGTPKLAELVRGAVQLPLVYRSFYWYSKDESRASETFHRRIMGALRTGDPERADILMKEHIYEGRDSLIEHLRASDKAPADADLEDESIAGG